MTLAGGALAAGLALNMAFWLVYRTPPSGDGFAVGWGNAVILAGILGLQVLIMAGLILWSVWRWRAGERPRPTAWLALGCNSPPLLLFLSGALVRSGSA